MKTINAIGLGFKGRHYYTLVVSKDDKKVFCLVDILSQASEEKYLLDRIADLNRVNINKRFGFYHCGETINFDALPIKYRNYKAIDNLNSFNLIENLEII